MTTRVDGVTSGIDTTSLIKAILTGYSVPRASAASAQASASATKEQYGQLKTLLDGLHTKLDALGTTAKVTSMKSTSSSAFTSTASPTAKAGNHRISVDKLAAPSVQASQSFGSRTATGAIPTGTYQITVGGVTAEVPVGAADTSLEGFASLLDDIEGVDAYTIDTGSGFALVVRAAESGFAHAVSLQSLDLDVGGVEPLMATKQDPSDASITLDGIVSTRSTNSFKDVLPGLSLDVSSITTGTQALDVTPDVASARDKLKEFVDAYNAVTTRITVQSKYNADAQFRGAFVGDGTIRRVDRSLRGSIAQEFDVPGSFKSLANIGIKTDGAGLLQIDDAKLDAALSTDFAGVADLFANANGIAAKALPALDLIVDPIDGTLETRMNSLDSKIASLQSQMDSWDDRITRKEAVLRKQFDAMEAITAQFKGMQTYIDSLLNNNSSS